MTEDTAVYQYMSKTEEPLVSVIIPVHNVSCYLSQCLESVIHQTYQNMEIIIIEDGSTDGSAVICDQYAYYDNRIRVMHTENKGLASARNLGVRHASGTYFSFIDSDDWMELHTIHTLVKIAMKTTADIVCAKICLEFVGQTIHSKEEKNQVQVFHGKEILPAYASGLFREVVWNKIYRADCFVHFYFPEGHNYEDVFTTWKRMKKLADEGGTVVSIPDELFHLRVRKSSITHTVNVQNIIDCWNAYYQKYEGLPEYQEDIMALGYRAILKMWLNYSGFSREEKSLAKGTILEMSNYSRATFHRVLRGEDSWINKTISLLSLSISPLLMWTCHYGGRLYKFLKKKSNRLKMFE